MEKQQFTRQRVRQQDLPPAVLAKWNAATLEEGFVPFPKKLLRCIAQVFRGGDAMERLALVLAIADYRRPNLSRGPSRDFLAFLAGLSPDRVTELLEELRRDGLISYGFKSADELDIDLDGLMAQIGKLTAETEPPF
jgi:hypothetical protein